MHINSRAAGFIFLAVFTCSLYGQKQVNTPYARFNIGTLNPQGSFRSLAMGGTGVAMRDNNSVYFCNPASYSGIDTASFIFNFGVDFAILKLDDGTDNFTSRDMNFNHLLMGFPLSRRIGVALGLLPVSNGYYYLSEKIESGDPGYDPIIGELAYVHKGTGSLSKAFAGAGVEISRNLSAGINFSVLLGEIQRLNQFEFADYASSYNQRGNEVLKISGINFDYGLQYTREFEKSRFLNLGLSYEGAKNYSSSHEVLKERFTIYNSSAYSPDTLSFYSNSAKDSTRLPSSVRAGIAFGKKDRFAVELDFSYTPWKDGRVHGESSMLGNISSFNFGLEYIPDKYSNTSFFKRIEYRLGGHYADNYLVINGTQLKEYGVSSGFAIRMRGSMSKATFYFDYTRKQGEIASGLHNENIYSFGVSLNLYDYWFIKRKFE
jgi:hypothetical protein